MTSTTANIQAAAKNQTRRKIEFDGYGYVNNIGASKYWGVSKTSPQCTTHDWRVRSFTGNPKLNEPNVHLTSSTVLTERQAAWVGAYFYENPNYTLPVVIQARDGVGEYRIGSDHNINYYEKPLTPSNFVEQVVGDGSMAPKRTAPALKAVASTKATAEPQGIAARAQAILDEQASGEQVVTDAEIAILHNMLDLIETQKDASPRFKAMVEAIFNI